MAESTKTFSTRQEKMVAKALGGYPIGGSGAMPCNPGDVKTYEWLVECKTHTTEGQSIAFKADVWKKIKDEAMAMHRKPVLVVDDGSQKEANTWCLCRRANLDMTGVIAVDIPFKVKTNITGKGDILKTNLVDSTKRYLGEFYTTGVYELDWQGDTVVVMPLATFKELFEK